VTEQPFDPQPRRVSLALPLHKPVVTWVLLGLILAVFALETAAGGSTETEVLVRLGAKVNPLIAQGEYWRLLSAMFLHIGLMHLAFNGYALAAIGTELERLLGWQRFLAIYLVSGLFGGLASYAFSDSLSAGASGAIFGIIGALAAFFLRHRQQLGAWGQRRLANIAFLIVINLVLGFTQPAIDNMAHLGGLISGFCLGWFLMPRYKLDPVAMHLVDENRLGRYWPVLAVAVLLLVGGVALATSVQRNSPAIYLLKAEEAIEREAWDEASTQLELALEQDPELGEAHFFLGLARNHLDEPQRAAESYESALALEPRFASAHWNLALTYLELARFAEAKDHFETYLELKPEAAVEVEPYLQDLREVLP
jgi:rhomboid protease GluP